MYTQAYGTNFSINELVVSEGMPLQEARRLVIMSDLMRVQMKRKCKINGHKLVDTSHGNAESGSIGVGCVRCGYSSSFTLY